MADQDNAQQKKQDAQYQEQLKAQTQQSKKLGDSITEMLARQAKSTDRIESMIDGYEKISKAMNLDKLGQNVKKMDQLAKKQKATFDLLEEFSYAAPGYVSKILSGGMTPKDIDSIIKLVGEAGKESGKNKAAVIADQKAILANYRELQARLNKAILAGDKAGVEAMQKQVESFVDDIKDVTVKLADATTKNLVLFQNVESGIQKKIAKMQDDLKQNTLMYKLLSSTRAGGGKGFAATGISNILKKERDENSHLGQLSKATGAGNVLGNFTDEEGKWSGAKATAYFAKKTLETGKMGWDTYRNTGRQFGMEAKGGSDLFWSTQNVRKKVNTVARDTGRSEEDTLAVLNEMAPAIRAGNKSYEERLQIQLQVTKETLLMERATGLSTSKIAAVTAAYRKNLGYGASESIKASHQIWDAMQDIKANVKDGDEATGEELADIFIKVAGDVDSAGLNMKTFSKYLTESYTYAKNLGIPLAKALELSQQIADLKSGRDTNAERSNLSLIALGNLTGVKSNQNDLELNKKLVSAEGEDLLKIFSDRLDKKSGLDLEGLKEKSKNGDKGATKTLEEYDQRKALLMPKSIVEADFLKNIMLGNKGAQDLNVFAKNGALAPDYVKFLARSKGGLGAEYGFDADVNAGFKKSGLNKVGGSTVVGHLITGLNTAKEIDAQILSASNKANGIENEVPQEKKDKDLDLMEKLSKWADRLTDPMSMFKTSVMAFAGSVLIFAGATVASFLSNRKLLNLIPKVGGGGGAASEAETLVEAQEAKMWAEKDAALKAEKAALSEKELLETEKVALAEKVASTEKTALSKGAETLAKKETLAATETLAKKEPGAIFRAFSSMGEKAKGVAGYSKKLVSGTTAEALEELKGIGPKVLGIGEKGAGFLKNLAKPATIAEAGLTSVIEGAIEAGYKGVTDYNNFVNQKTQDDEMVKVYGQNVMKKDRVKSFGEDWNNLKGLDDEGNSVGGLGMQTSYAVKGVIGGIGDIFGTIKDTTVEFIRSMDILLKPKDLSDQDIANLPNSSLPSGSYKTAQANAYDNCTVEADGTIVSTIRLPRSAINKSDLIDKTNKGQGNLGVG